MNISKTIKAKIKIGKTIKCKNQDSQNAKMRVEVENKPGHEIIVASDDVIAEYKKILAPIEANWLAEMKGKGLDGDAVLKRARQIISKIDG